MATLKLITVRTCDKSNPAVFWFSILSFFIRLFSITLSVYILYKQSLKCSCWPRFKRTLNINKGFYSWNKQQQLRMLCSLCLLMTLCFNLIQYIALFIIDPPTTFEQHQRAIPWVILSRISAILYQISFWMMTYTLVLSEMDRYIRINMVVPKSLHFRVLHLTSILLAIMIFTQVCASVVDNAVGLSWDIHYEKPEGLNQVTRALSDFADLFTIVPLTLAIPLEFYLNLSMVRNVFYNVQPVPIQNHGRLVDKVSTGVSSHLTSGITSTANYYTSMNTSQVEFTPNTASFDGMSPLHHETSSLSEPTKLSPTRHPAVQGMQRTSWRNQRENKRRVILLLSTVYIANTMAGVLVALAITVAIEQHIPLLVMSVSTASITVLASFGLNDLLLFCLQERETGINMETSLSIYRMGTDVVLEGLQDNKLLKHHADTLTSLELHFMGDSDPCKTDIARPSTGTFSR